MKRQGSLLIEEPPLQVLPKLAKVIGLNEAILLQQIHYWLGRSENIRDGRKWVYKTSQEWVDEFPFWSEATVKRVVLSLKERKLIEVAKESSSSWNRTNWYSVNYEELGRIGAICTDASDQFAPMHPVNLTKSIGSNCANRSGQSDPMTLTTETTSKTTTEKPRILRPGEDYTPTPAVLAWVKKNGFAPWLDLHVEEFRDTCTTQARKPYSVAGLDAAFRKCVRADWGGVRRQAQIAARAPGGASLQSRTQQLCRYCSKTAVNTVSGIPFCSAKVCENAAYDGRPAPKSEEARA